MLYLKYSKHALLLVLILVLDLSFKIRHNLHVMCAKNCENTFLNTNISVVNNFDELIFILENLEEKSTENLNQVNTYTSKDEATLKSESLSSYNKIIETEYSKKNLFRGLERYNKDLFFKPFQKFVNITTMIKNKHLSPLITNIRAEIFELYYSNKSEITESSLSFDKKDFEKKTVCDSENIYKILIRLKINNMYQCCKKDNFCDSFDVKFMQTFFPSIYLDQINESKGIFNKESDLEYFSSNFIKYINDHMNHVNCEEVLKMQSEYRYYYNNVKKLDDIFKKVWDQSLEKKSNFIVIKFPLDILKNSDVFRKNLHNLYDKQDKIKSESENQNYQINEILVHLVDFYRENDANPLHYQSKIFYEIQTEDEIKDKFIALLDSENLGYYIDYCTISSCSNLVQIKNIYSKLFNHPKKNRNRFEPKTEVLLIMSIFTRHWSEDNSYIMSALNFSLKLEFDKKFRLSKKDVHLYDCIEIKTLDDLDLNIQKYELCSGYYKLLSEQLSFENIKRELNNRKSYCSFNQMIEIVFPKFYDKFEKDEILAEFLNIIGEKLNKDKIARENSVNHTIPKRKQENNCQSGKRKCRKAS